MSALAVALVCLCGVLGFASCLALGLCIVAKEADELTERLLANETRRTTTCAGK
jgi:hypothetical protein